MCGFDLQEEEESPVLTASPTAKALIHIFFAQRSAFKVCSLPKLLDFEAGFKS